MPTIKNPYQAPDFEMNVIVPQAIIAASATLENTLEDYDVVTEEW